MEIDIDDVPWKAELVTRAAGHRVRPHSSVPTAPGWGAEIDEDVLRAHPWPNPARGKQTFYGMSPEQMTARPSRS